MFVEKNDKIGLWESNLNHYIFPQTFHSPEFARKCKACYIPNQRAIIAPSGEIIFTITIKTIELMMQGSYVENNTPFSIESLIELYQKLYFAKIARFFDLFLHENTQLPRKNPPYPYYIFPDQAKKIISALSYILGYYFDQLVYEPILGFLSIFSTDNKPSIIFNFSQFLAHNIHEQLLKLPT